MKTLMRLLMLTAIIFTCSASARSNTETLYVTDQLDINMRSGTSTRHQITQLVKSGASVQILKSNEGKGYSKVRLTNGKEGWILSRYLVDQPSARDRLAEATRQLNSLQGDSGALRDELATLRKENRALSNNVASLSNNNSKLDKEITRIKRVASDAMKIDRENQQLQSTMNELKSSYQSMEQDNILLRSNAARDWFLIGGGVLFFGILFGLIIPKIRWKKKASWSSL